jgi:hypothetical protein
MNYNGFSITKGVCQLEINEGGSCFKKDNKKKGISNTCSDEQKCSIPPKNYGVA